MDGLVPVPLGFLLGFLIGLTGVGGGALVAPALYVILGLSYAEAVALSLVYSLFTKIVSGLQHLRQGTVVWPITLLYGLTGIPGTLIGARLVYVADPAIQRALPLVMTGVLLVVASALLLETALGTPAARWRRLSPREIGGRAALAITAYQLLVGALLGMTSVGSGSLVILSMLFLFRMSVPEIVGSNIVIALIMVVPASLAHHATGGVPWRLLGLLLGGSLVGAVLGSRATLWVTDRTLKVAIAVLIVLGAVSTMVKAQL